MSAIPLPSLSEREMLPDDQMKDLIYESMRIVAGDTMKLATNLHLKALLEERSNLVAALAQAKDGLANAADALSGNDKDMAIAHFRDVHAQLRETDFLEKREAHWVRKVLYGRD
jgi:hypothetical protein